jgi:hypothetical protein
MSSIALSEATFKEAVKTYVALHDELQLGSKRLADLRKKRKELMDAILEFMRVKGIDEFQIADGKLMRKASKRTEGLKKEHVAHSLKTVLQCGDDKIEACLSHLMNARQTTESETLRRTRQGKTTADVDDDDIGDGEE